MNDSRPVVGHSEFHNLTTVHPLGLTVLMLLGIAMLTLPRRHAIISVLACASFIAVGQRVVVFSLDFDFMRLMVLFGWARIILYREYLRFRWTTLDYWVVAWGLCALLIYPVSHGALGIVFQLGHNFDSVGMYFLARMLIRDLADVRSLINAMVIISLPVTIAFFVEHQTHRNLFAVFGGVPEITMIREGKLRCQGAYAHPILAGCFWAAILPLFIGRICSRGFGRLMALAGLMTSLAIVGMCASATPIMGVLATVAGFALLPLRKSMQAVRWMIVLLLIGLHMSMKAPVWHLISRTDIVGGSSGWHRFFLIDQWIKHCHEWAAFGIADISHWGVFANDVTNQYVKEAVNGGGLTLAVFTVMIAVAFGGVGRLWRTVAHTPRQMILAWAIGVSLFVHTVCFLSVSYFGQIDMLWYLSLALTAVVPSNKSAVGIRRRAGVSENTVGAYHRVLARMVPIPPV